MKSHEFTVEPAHSGKRLDVYLVEAGMGLSRRKIRQVIDVGGVYVNRRRVRIASRQVTRGDKIRFEYNEGALKELKTQRPEFAAGDILLQLPGVVAVNKPPGMPSQATKDQSIMHVVTCLETLYQTLQRPRAAFILVHRLDKETSGVLLVATNKERATWLTDQFREREVSKTYLALCHGLAKELRFTEKAYLSEIDKRTGDVRVVRAGGRSAVTHFQVLRVNKELGVSLLACYPETGRSHQIRVHLQHQGLPIVGDKRYGAAAGRTLAGELQDLASVHQFLHARALAFIPAKGQPPVTVEAPLPPRFAAALQALGMAEPKLAELVHPE